MINFFIPCIDFYVGHMYIKLLKFPAPHKKVRIAALEGRTFLWQFFLRNAQGEERSSFYCESLHINEIHRNTRVA
jgi:hypothetical protein